MKITPKRPQKRWSREAELTDDDGKRATITAHLKPAPIDSFRTPAGNALVHWYKKPLRNRDGSPVLNTDGSQAFRLSYREPKPGRPKGSGALVPFDAAIFIQMRLWEIELESELGAARMTAEWLIDNGAGRNLDRDYLANQLRHQYRENMKKALGLPRFHASASKKPAKHK